MRKEHCSCLRMRMIEFLIRSAQLLGVFPIVKYSALSLFAERFCPALLRIQNKRHNGNWLIHPIEESKLQLFALVSLWVSSKIHDSSPLSVQSLKLLSDKYIQDQHYTKGDLLEAVLKFKIGTLNIAYLVVEELHRQLKAVACLGEHVKFEVCEDIMDLLYETEEMSALYNYNSPKAVAASILVAAYVITVPTQKWEFPILPWAQFATSCREKEIMDNVNVILNHIFQPQAH